MSNLVQHCPICKTSFVTGQDLNGHLRFAHDSVSAPEAARAELLQVYNDFWRRCNNTIVSDHHTLEGLRHSLGCISDEQRMERDGEWLAEHKERFAEYRKEFWLALERYDMAREQVNGSNV